MPVKYTNMGLNLLVTLVAISGQTAADVQDADIGIALVQACRNNKIAEVQSLLDRGAPIDAQDKAGFRPLVSAATYGHVAVMELLLTRGASVDQQSTQGISALAAAVDSQNPAAVKLLLSKKARLDLADKQGIYAIHRAAQEKNVAVLDALIAAGVDLDVVSDKGVEPLVFAAYAGRLENVRHMLAAGATLQLIKSPNPWSAAEEGSHPEIIRVLVEYLKNPPALPERATKTTPDPLMAAIVAGRNDEVAALISDPAYRDEGRLSGAIVCARQFGRISIEEQLTKANARLSEMHQRRQKLCEELRQAVDKGDERQVIALLKQGADPNYRDKNGSVFLWINDKNKRAVEILLRNGGDPFDPRKPKDSQPFYYAVSVADVASMMMYARFGNLSQQDMDEALQNVGSEYSKGEHLTQAIDFLLKQGATLRGVGAAKRSPLFAAAVNRSAEATAILLKAGARPDITNEGGQHAVDIAAMFGNVDTIALLVKSGSPPPAIKVLSPLFLALDDRDYDRLRELIRQGQDLSATNYGEMPATVMRYAIQTHAPADVIEFLLEKKAPGKPLLLFDLMENVDYYRKDYRKLFNAMVEHGYDVNQADSWGYTPLMIAAYRGDAVMVDYLLAKGARIDARNRDGLTAAQKATAGGYIHIAELLDKAAKSK